MAKTCKNAIETSKCTAFAYKKHAGHAYAVQNAIYLLYKCQMHSIQVLRHKNRLGHNVLAYVYIPIYVLCLMVFDL